MDTMSFHEQTYGSQTMNDTYRVWPVCVCVLRTLTYGTRYATNQNTLGRTYDCEEHAILRGRVAACSWRRGAGD